MNEVELQIAIQIAAIDGVRYELTENGNGPILLMTIEDPACTYNEVYNPFEWDVLGPLMHKYGLAVECHDNKPDGRVYISNGKRFCFSDIDDFPRAVLECIIHSKRG